MGEETSSSRSGVSADPIVCRSYTFARRYPLVIGKISGWAPFWGPATPTQYAVAVGSALLLLWTRQYWARFLPGPLSVLIIVAVPFGLAWAVRSARFEHRAPMRALLGLATVLMTPPKGRVNGRAYFEPRPRPLRGNRIFVTELPARPARRRRGRRG
jgi:hypothetical protein